MYTKHLTALLRIAIKGKAAIGPAFSLFNTHPVEWDALMKQAAYQNVLPIAFDALEMLYREGGLDIPLPTKMAWAGATLQGEKIYQRHSEVIRRLAAFYSEHGIRMMVLKGYSLSLLYPKPQHRPCGDIDIYLYGRQAEADRLLTERAGIRVDYSHHHHTVCSVMGVMVENHYDFINVHAHASAPWLEKELKRLAAEESEGTPDGVCLPPPTLHALFLLRHAAQHFAAERIELRHLIDWYLFKQRYGAKVRWNEVCHAAEAVGMLHFMHALDDAATAVVEGGEEGLNAEAHFVWNEIWHPTFDREAPAKPLPRLLFKWRRWWCNRRKNRFVYRESLLNQLFHLIISRCKKTGGRE